MQCLSVLIGKPEKTPAKSGLTGFFKKPVSTAYIGKMGLEGDHIVDQQHHGGVDQAVYVFGDNDRIWWAQALDRDLPAGFFGENLLISDLETGRLAVGDVLELGSATLQITSPRIPCATYAAHIGTGDAIKQFYAAERPGVYARVLKAGIAAAGDHVALTPYPGIRITMIEVMRHYLRKYDDHAFLARLLHTPAHHKMHELARERLGKP